MRDRDRKLPMAGTDGFEPTLAKLRAQREAVERHLLERLEDLADRVRAARDSATAAEELASTVVVDAREDGGADDDHSRVVPLPEAASPADQAPWAAASGWRRLLARPLRWLLHDYIGTLDARHEALATALQQRDRRLTEAVRSLDAALLAQVEGLAGQARRLRERQQRQRSQVESVRELATRCVEALDRVADVVLHIRDLLNAKEAETVQVATEGIRARTGLLLGELARQQEALLSELVGRRRELDEILGQLEQRSADAGPSS